MNRSDGMDTETAIKEIKDIIELEWRHRFPADLAPDYIEALEMAIEALEKQMPKKPTYQPWVSVEDGLPDGDVASVLIYTNEGGVSEGQYYPSIKSWKQFRWSVENADVTHWKPLPAPPKEEY